MDKAPSFYNRTCLPSSTFLKTKQEKECSAPAQYRTSPEQSCQVSDVPIQLDFDMKLFNGTWYEMQWLAQMFFPASELFQDYQHEYIIQEDGSLKGYIKGRTDKGCFYRQVSLTSSETPGKLHFNLTEGGSAYYPYWIVDTDYDNYAVMYGCLNVSTSGNCTAARSTVWSRRESLAPRFQYRANTIVQNLCVNPAAFLLTSQKNACASCYKQPCGTETGGGATYTADSQLLIFAVTVLLSI
ncbi:purpurin-like [Haliotis rufescens]|uniref:purpurin-like n=1 Tax=Haliotis rufescens TaxID=6454 RepID=UPI00201EDAA8|nr:purpurin-like [Haliotis rufescens]